MTIIIDGMNVLIRYFKDAKWFPEFVFTVY